MFFNILKLIFVIAISNFLILNFSYSEIVKDIKIIGNDRVSKKQLLCSRKLRLIKIIIKKI